MFITAIRKKVLIITGLLVLALIIIVYLYFISLQLQQKQQVFVKQNLDITELDFSQPSLKVFKVRGKFTSKLREAYGLTIGDFIINGDNTKISVPVYFPPSKNSIKFGQADLFGNVTFVLTPMSQVITKISPGQIIELRLVFERNEQENKSLIASLQQMKVNGIVEFQKIAFVPTMLSIVKNE